MESITIFKVSGIVSSTVSSCPFPKHQLRMTNPNTDGEILTISCDMCDWKIEVETRGEEDDLMERYDTGTHQQYHEWACKYCKERFDKQTENLAWQIHKIGHKLDDLISAIRGER